MFAKAAPKFFQDKQEKRWERQPLAKLQGKTLGIIGLGKIGRHMAHIGKALE
jgi:phosphoglycerate dehydrogenase-like enzyme